MEVKVLGHLAPDTDSTCTPVVYAWFLTNHMNTPAQPVVAGEYNKEAAYLLEKFGIAAPTRIEQLTADDKYILLDTNNPQELVQGYQSAELLEIIDHHKLVAGLETSGPIRVTIRPVACVATIVWGMIKSNIGMEIPANMAGLLLGAILSDTLKFTSPTTTDKDRESAAELAQIAGVNIDELAQAMFDAKSDLTGMNVSDILMVDSKVFEMGSRKVRVSVLETTKPANALSQIDAIKTTMAALKQSEALDGIFFFVVDILNTSAELMVSDANDEAMAIKAFNGTFVNGTMHLPGMVSRKKQMVPGLEAVYKA